MFDCCQKILITLSGFSCQCFGTCKYHTPLWVDSKDGILLHLLLPLENLALPDISYCLSQGRYVIHISIVGKEFSFWDSKAEGEPVPLDPGPPQAAQSFEIVFTLGQSQWWRKKNLVEIFTDFFFIIILVCCPSMKRECDYLYGWIRKRIHKQTSHPNGEPQRYSWERRRRSLLSWLAHESLRWALQAVWSWASLSSCPQV